jgi:hypothetical protein
MKRLLIAALAACLFPISAGAATLPKSKLTITSAIGVDTTNHTVTLPLHKQRLGSTTVWYIITDASTAAAAKRLGVNFAPSIAAVPVLRSIAPDFSPARTYVASAGGFPPKSAAPGGIARNDYSPFIMSEGAVLNAPVVATGDGPFDVTTHTNTEDRVVAIDTKKMTVTLVVARGFFNGKPVYYISTEASDPVAASVERATYEPNLRKITLEGQIPIGVIVNGPQTGSAPQGLAFLALRTPLDKDATAANASTIMSSFNVLSAAPTLGKLYANSGYTPVWNVMAVGAKQSKRLTSYAEVAAIAKDAGFVVNCPVVAYGDESAY